MYIDVTEKEAYLLYLLKQNPDSAKAVYRIMDMPYDDDYLSYLKKWHREQIQNEYDLLKKDRMETMKEKKKKALCLQSIISLDKCCREKEAESDAYWDQKQALAMDRMQAWLKCQKPKLSVIR